MNGIVAFERILGMIANAILMATIVAVAMKPENPIWICPRLVLDTSQPGKERLTFRYWVRYPEGRFLYDCVCTVRFQSDRAVRSIDRSTEIDTRHVEEHYIRRGTSEVHLGFDTLEEGIPGKPEGPARKHALACMLLAAYADPGFVYKVSFGTYEESVYLTEQLKRKYSNYHILFRVVGTTRDGKHVFNEVQYKLSDVLFGYVFLTAEEVASSRVSNLWNMIHERSYSYRFGNMWRVTKCEELGQKSLDRTMIFDIDGTESSLRAKKCIKRVGQPDGIPYGSGRPVSNTATVRIASRFDRGAMEKLYARVKDYGHKRYSDSEVAVRVERSVKATPCSDDCSFAVVARDGKTLVGFLLVIDPSSSENPGYVLGYSDEEAKLVAVIDATVVHPDYRGQRLQKRMLALAEESAVAKGKLIFIAQVDVDNEYAMRNFFEQGYKRCKTYRDSEGVARELLVKRFRSTY